VGDEARAITRDQRTHPVWAAQPRGRRQPADMLATQANGTVMAWKISNYRGEPPAATRIPTLNCKNTPGAGDENQARTISLGSLWRCIAVTCRSADLRLCLRVARKRP
jgi:hypothetical protein